MRSIFYAPQAKKDLHDIQSFIAQNDPSMASSVIETILNFTNMLTIFPLIGTENPLLPGERYIVEPTFKYYVYYKIDAMDILIIAVFKYMNR